MFSNKTRDDENEGWISLDSTVGIIQMLKTKVNFDILAVLKNIEAK